MKVKTMITSSFANIVRKCLYDYDIPVRSCYAVMDDFGNLVPCNHTTWHSIL